MERSSTIGTHYNLPSDPLSSMGLRYHISASEKIHGSREWRLRGNARQLLVLYVQVHGLASLDLWNAPWCQLLSIATVDTG